MTNNDILSKISELCSRMEDLHNQSTNNPDGSGKALKEALEELQTIQQELQARDRCEIAKSKEAEETCWLCEERFRVLTRCLRSGVALMNESGKVVEYNSAFLSILGLADGPSNIKDINDLNWGDWEVFGEEGNILNVDDHPIRKAAITCKPVMNLLVNVRLSPGRALIRMLISVEPILKPDGKIASLICTCQDVNELDRVEKALQQSEEKYRLLIKNAPSMIYEMDFKGQKFKSVNDMMCKTLGYSREELLGMNPSDLLEGPSKTAFKDRIRRTQGGEPIKDFIEYRVRTKDGRELVGVLRTTIIFKNGEPESALVVAHDFTERKQMEKKLARMVLERTEALSKAKLELEVANEELRLDLVKHERLEASLVEAKEAAEAAVRAKSDFMANMSHEIRTPMNAVIGMTSILLDDADLNPEQKDFIETIRMNGDALMVIINDILDFSKMESERTMLEEQPFELRGNVEEALDLVSATAAEKRLNLAYCIDKEVPECIIGDPTRLRQILGNLLHNAVKFTESGEIKLSVSASELSGTGTHQIHFAVQDMRVKRHSSGSSPSWRARAC